MDAGLVVARLVFGLVMAAHGAQKLFGWFGGGLLLALGLFGPVGPALVIGVMTVATMSVHRQNGLFATSHGIELPLLYATFAAAIALTGPGRYSLDVLLGLASPWTPGLSWSAIAIGIVGAIVNLAFRRTPAAVAA